MIIKIKVLSLRYFEIKNISFDYLFFFILILIFFLSIIIYIILQKIIYVNKRSSVVGSKRAPASNFLITFATFLLGLTSILLKNHFFIMSKTWKPSCVCCVCVVRVSIVKWMLYIILSTTNETQRTIRNKKKTKSKIKKKRAKAVHRQTSGPSSPQHRQPYPGFIPFFWVPHKWVYVFFFHVGWWWLTFVTSMLEVHQDSSSICFVENDVCPANVTMTPTSFVECHQCI